MNVLFTGGGTGGHFYPIIAIAQELQKLVRNEHFVNVRMYFMSDGPYDKNLLFENKITYIEVRTGKMRRYFSILNIFDLFKTGFAILKALFHMFMLYPDVVIGKGGYASFPALFAAKMLRIPVIIHESDSAPGRVNAWASKFAKKIAISYKEASEYFPENKTALTGNPVRKEVVSQPTIGAYSLLDIEKETPVLLILGGSQGAKMINDIVLRSLPELIKKYQIIHQVGVSNLKEMQDMSKVIIGNLKDKNRYKIFGYLNSNALRMSAGVADIVISRAGSTIFEIATWGLPSIIIPITESGADHQRKNAYSYARALACEVIEEKNLTPSIFIGEIDRLFDDKERMSEMSKNAKAFSNTNAALKIAEQIIILLKKHQEIN